MVTPPRTLRARLVQTRSVGTIEEPTDALLQEDFLANQEVLGKD